MSDHNYVDVAIGIILRKDEVLIAKRPQFAHLGGLWEFPGGKFEQDESAYEALVRELHEELGIDVTHGREFFVLEHVYRDKPIRLHVWLVDAFSGEAHGSEQQEIRWVKVEDIHQYAFPDANQPIVNALQLPQDYVISGPGAADEEAYLAKLGRVFEQGYRLVQLRAKSLSCDDYRSLAEKAVELARGSAVQLLLNCDDSSLVSDVGADGWHMTSKQLWSDCKRSEGCRWWAASCHTKDDLLRAKRMGVDFVVLSPVLATPSHPEKVPLGWEQFAELVQIAQLPVFALGGLSFDERDVAVAYGGQGISGISMYWG